MKITAEEIYLSVELLRRKSPVVHNITNYVAMNNTANALLAIGASPVMAHALEEVEEMVAIAQSLTINIGTLSEAWIAAMFLAADKAVATGIPFVLDPVGAGATTFRTKTARKLLEKKPTVIRGNASEIMALCDDKAQTKGVDSVAPADKAVLIAEKISLDFNCVVVVSGPIDYIIRGKDRIKVKNGHQLMTRVTGLGCTASALCGAFAAVERNYFEAAAKAMAVMGIVGEIAASQAAGPGSLQTKFIDVLYQLSEADIARYLKIEK